MSLSAALNIASSGLSASSKMTQIISNNVANAMTEGYARREVNLSSQSSGGVTVDSITRMVNESLMKEKRLGDAAAGNAAITTAFYSKIENAIGDIGASGSLSFLMSSLDTSLIEAMSQPDSRPRLETVLSSAQSIVKKINNISQTIQDERQAADRSIAVQVDTLNTALQKIADLNVSITRLKSQGGDANSLIDQRQSLMGEISEIVPVNVVERSGGQVSIITTGGQTLLDGTATKIEFRATPIITPSMDISDGSLSGLSINGLSLSTHESGYMAGGTLSATFAVRDTLTQQANSDLDAFAANLISRFSSTTVDATLSSNTPGLFTDAGEIYTPATELGVASRISVNALIDPAHSGAIWRIRDGIGATEEGPTGDSRLLNALQVALVSSETISSGSNINRRLSPTELAVEILSHISSNRLNAEKFEGYAVSKQEAANTLVLSQGVDSDHELQTLLTVEQAWAANARVIQTIDDMIRTILEI